MPERPRSTDGSNRPRPGRPRRLLKRTMIYLLAIYLVWLLIGCSIQRSILFPRSMAGGPRQAAVPGGVQVVYIDSPQGRVEGWFIPGDGVSAEAPGPVVIFAHGNAELIDYWPDGLYGYTRLGVSVLLPEYRGYGRSPGDPSQRAIGEDFTSFYDRVIQRPEVDPSRVVLHGRSIGGGVAAQLASDRPSAALILQSSPSSIKRIAARFLVPWFLVRDPFDSVRVVRDYKQPVLVMHGSADRIIPPSHARRLANAAANPISRLIMYRVDHNTLPPDGPYWDDIEQFLKDADVLE
jgi:fermentation-respiration switch protein FrsA (DUF1100 family)